MSMVPSTPGVPDPTTATGLTSVVTSDPLHTADVPSPILDAALPAVAAQLRPLFAEVAKAAVEEAIKAVPTPSFRPGTVQGVNITTGDVTVLMDGDTSTSTVQSIAGVPIYNERVMVCFVPPSSAFVIGYMGGGTFVPAGVMLPYAGIITTDVRGSSGTAPPAGWLWCHGQTVAQASYPGLYAAIGTTYNTGGEAATDFRLPDMRDLFPLGMGNMGGGVRGLYGSLSNTLGATGGVSAISSAMLPAHAHGFTPTGSVSISSVTGNVSISDPTHAHNYTAWQNGSTSFATGAGFAADSTTSGTTGASTGISASFSFTGGSGSFTGDAGNTDNGPGSGSEFLPRAMRTHYIIKG